MKVGILGTGMGAYHARLYQKMEQVDSIILYGRNHEKLDKIEKDLGIAVTDKFEDVLCDPEVALVDVCLPSEAHVEYVVKALEAGKDVFCETPFALSLEEAERMEQAAVKSGHKVFVNMFIKFENSYTWLMEFAAGMSMGRLKTLHMRRKTPPIWGDLGLSRISVHLMIHEFDFITAMLGKPLKIHAAGIQSAPGEANVETLMLFEDAAVMVQASSMMPKKHPFTVGYDAIFEHGTVEFVEDGYGDRCERTIKAYTNGKFELIELPECNCFEESLRHVVDCCMTGKPSILGIDQAKDSLEIALEIKRQIE